MQCMTQEDLLSLLTNPMDMFDTRQFVVLNRTQPAGRLVFTVTNESGKEIVLYIEPVPRVQDLTKIATFSQLLRSSSLRMLISQNKMNILSISPDGKYIQPMERPEFFLIREGDIYLSGKTQTGAIVSLKGTTQKATADSNGYFFLHVGIAKRPDITVTVSLTGFRSTDFKINVEDSRLGSLVRPQLLGLSVSSTSISGRTVPGATITLTVGDSSFSSTSDIHGSFVLICDPLTSDIAYLKISAVGYETMQFEYEPLKRNAVLRVPQLYFLSNLVDGFTEPNSTVRIRIDGQPEHTAYADENGVFTKQVMPIKGNVEVEAVHRDFFNRIQTIQPKLAIFEYAAVDTAYSTHTAIVVRLKVPTEAEQVEVTLTLPDGAIATQTTDEKGFVDVVFTGLSLINLVGEASFKVQSQFFVPVIKKFPVIETNVIAEPHLLQFVEGDTVIQGLVGANAGRVTLRTPDGTVYNNSIQDKGKFVIITNEPIALGLHEFEFEVMHYPTAIFTFEPNPKPIKEVI